MTPWEDEVVARLKAFSDLDALIDGRVRPVVLAPDDDLPALTYRWSTVSPTANFGRDARLVDGELQVTCWGETYDQAKDVTIQTYRALNRWPQVSGYAGVLQDLYLLSYGDREYDETVAEFGRDLIFRVVATGSLTA